MKDDEIKVKIAEVAKREFLELGYVDASMRNISGKAGLTTGSLYNRFRDKAELFEYIVGDSVNGVFETIDHVNNAVSTVSDAIIGKIIEVVKMFFQKKDIKKEND